MGKNIPDNSINTLEAAHTEMELTNACLDSLFEAQPSFIRSLTISASNDVLSMVQAINIPEIDITDFTENKEFEYTIMEILPRGVKNVSSNKVIKVTVMVNNIRRDPPEYDRNNPDRNRDINPDRVQDRNQGKVDEPTANVIVSPTTTTANSRSDVDNDTTNAHNDSEEETTIEEMSE